MSDVPERYKIYCGVKHMAQLDRLMEQGIDPLAPIGPWPVLCPACGGKNSKRVIPMSDRAPDGFVVLPLHFESVYAPLCKYAVCSTCDGRGTVIA